MRKLFKHLKPYAATIAAIVVILIVQAYCDEKEIEKRADGSACMKKETIEQLSSDETHNITIVLQ